MVREAAVLEEVASLRQGLTAVAEAVRAMQPLLEAELEQRCAQAEENAASRFDQSLRGLKAELQAELQVELADVLPLRGLVRDVSELLAVQAKPRLSALERDLSVCWHRVAALEKLMESDASHSTDRRDSAEVQLQRDLRRGLACARTELNEVLGVHAERRYDELDRTCTELREMQEMHCERLTEQLTDRLSDTFAQQVQWLDARLCAAERRLGETEGLQRGAFEELVVDAAMASGEALVRATRALGAEVALERRQRVAEQERSERTLEAIAENCVAALLPRKVERERDEEDTAVHERRSVSSSTSGSLSSPIPSILSVPLQMDRAI